MSRAPYSVPRDPCMPKAGGVTMFDTALGWRYPNPKMEALFKALTATTEPDGEVEVSFWADEVADLERLYFRTSSPKGESADALLMPTSGEPRRVADMAALVEVAA